MDKISLQNYQVEDFISDESFINYHFRSNKNDRLFWEAWLADHPEKQAMVQEAVEIIETLSLKIPEKEYREELKKISKAISTGNKRDLVPQQATANKFSRRNHRKKRMMQYLLPFLLILLAGGYWIFQSSKRHSEKFTETANNTNLPLVLTLSDSTVVTLSPHSSLGYPLHFYNKERDVYLHGDARFAVKRDPEHPFKVHAENIIATVLGTIFNIKHSGDSAIEVELLKGKLNVETINAKMEPEQSVLLVPDEKAVYIKNAGHLYKDKYVPDSYVSFSKNNFDEIAGKIKDVFGITVINSGNNTAWRFTGPFRNSTAKDIMENICLVKKLSFVVKGDTIIINK